MLDKIDAFGCDRFLHRNEKLRQLVSVGLEATTPAGDHDAAIAAAEHRLRALQQLPPSTPTPTIPDTHPMPRRFDRQDHPQHQYTEEPSAHHKGKLDGAIRIGLVASSKVKVFASAGGFHFALTTSSEELAEAHAGELFDEI